MDSDRAHQLLAAERERIEREIAELGPEAAGPTATSPAIAARRTSTSRSSTPAARRPPDQLAAVERAEARLADGTYGLSVESGEPIPDGRLEALPTAERTVAEEERLGGG